MAQICGDGFGGIPWAPLRVKQGSKRQFITFRGDPGGPAWEQGPAPLAPPRVGWANHGLYGALAPETSHRGRGDEGK